MARDGPGAKCKMSMSTDVDAELSGRLAFCMRTGTTKAYVRVERGRGAVLIFVYGLF
jgi:hypothetical protein